MIYALSVAAAAFTPGAPIATSRAAMTRATSPEMAVVIGLAADSGCGKSTFMRRMTGIFGGESKLLDIGRETNTLVSDMTTVICLDDYHKYDRVQRKSCPDFPDGITALHKDCQDWDKMAADVTDLKSGKAVSKPIYNHITGALDPNEDVSPTPIVIFEGLHPMHDDRVNEALDLTVYLDITDEVKFAWKAQRDIGGCAGGDRCAQARLRRLRGAAEGQGRHYRAGALLRPDRRPHGQVPQGEAHPEELDQGDHAA